MWSYYYYNSPSAYKYHYVLLTRYFAPSAVLTNTDGTCYPSTHSSSKFVRKLDEIEVRQFNSAGHDLESWGE